MSGSTLGSTSATSAGAGTAPVGPYSPVITLSKKSVITTTTGRTWRITSFSINGRTVNFDKATTDRMTHAYEGALKDYIETLEAGGVLKDTRKISLSFSRVEGLNTMDGNEGKMMETIRNHPWLFTGVNGLTRFCTANQVKLDPTHPDITDTFFDEITLEKADGKKEKIKANDLYNKFDDPTALQAAIHKMGKLHDRNMPLFTEPLAKKPKTASTGSSAAAKGTSPTIAASAIEKISVGSGGNCAAESLAKGLIQKFNGDFAAIAHHLGNPVGTNEKELVERLRFIASDKIAKLPEFAETAFKKGCFGAVLKALWDANKDYHAQLDQLTEAELGMPKADFFKLIGEFRDESTYTEAQRKALAGAYSAYISKDKVYLDEPFFVALNIPIAILQATADGNVRIKQYFPFNQPIDRDDTIFISYNGSIHYEGVNQAADQEIVKKKDVLFDEFAKYNIAFIDTLLEDSKKIKQDQDGPMLAFNQKDARAAAGLPIFVDTMVQVTNGRMNILKNDISSLANGDPKAYQAFKTYLQTTLGVGYIVEINDNPSIAFENEMDSNAQYFFGILEKTADINTIRTAILANM